MASNFEEVLAQLDEELGRVNAAILRLERNQSPGRRSQLGSQNRNARARSAIHDLCAEKENLERAISSLEKLQGAAAGGHGISTTRRRGRHCMEESERLEVSDRMKRYWASRRKKQGESQAEPSSPTVF